MRILTRVLTIFLALAAICLFCTCEGTIGLGSAINTDKPVISIPDDGISRPGSFLRGKSNIIYLEVEQKFGIKAVYMTYWWFAEENGAKQRHERSLEAEFDSAAGRYYVDIDSLEIPDGTIWAQVTAVDSSGNTSTTTEMVYIVKNTPPEIELTIPRIKGDEFDDPYLNARLRGEPLYQGSDLMGIAKDILGIAAGYPQIMIWRDGDDCDGDNAPASDRRQWGVWRTALDDKLTPLDAYNLNALQFRWPMVEFEKTAANTWQLPQNAGDYKELESGQYRFKIRIMDMYGTVNVYPHRENCNREITAPEDQLKYMQIELAAADNPVIRWMPKPPPQYYNGSAPLEATVTITSGNAIEPDMIKAWVCNSDFEAVSPARPSYVKRIGNTAEYHVSIPCEDITKVSGDMMLYVEAEDIQKNAGASSRGFVMDVDAPKLDFIEPLRFGEAINPNPALKIPEGLQRTSTVFIRGTTNDDTSRVTAMYYALGKTETGNPSLGLTLNDNSGWLPTGLGASPVDRHYYGQGGFEVKIEWDGSLSSWSLRLDDISALCDKAVPVAGNYYVKDYNSAKNLWLLPVKFKVIDMAGNVSIRSAEIIADPGADLPVVNVNSHSDRQIVGGLVRVSGMAIDNEWISEINVRITAQSNDECDTNAAPKTPVTGGFVPANIVGSKSAAVNWYCEINKDGSLDPPHGKGSRVVKMEIMARDASMYSSDTPKNSSDITTLYLVFDLSVPVIENEVVIHRRPSAPDFGTAAREPFSPGATVREFVTLKAIVKDDSGIVSIRLRGHGQAAYIDLIQAGSFRPNDSSPWVNPIGAKVNGLYLQYEVYIPIDTGVMFANTAGVCDTVIQAVDNTSPNPFITLKTLSVLVDNYYPLASFGGDLNAIGSYGISGEAWDTGSGINVQGIDCVVVYFSRNGDLLPLDGGSASFASTPQMAMKGRRGNLNGPFAGEGGTLQELSSPDFPDVQAERHRRADGTYKNTFRTTNSGIVINRTGWDYKTDLGADSSRTDKGYYQTFDNYAGGMRWAVNFPSAQLPPGPAVLHYVVFDSIGNASYYEQEIYIANNRPVISRISLGTDVNKDSVISADEYVDYGNGFVSVDTIPGYTEGKREVNFRVRNKKFNLKLDVIGGSGNGAQYYRVSHVKRNGPFDNAALVKGQVYTVAHDAGNINWVDCGVFGKPDGANCNEITFVATAGLASTGKSSVYTYSPVNNWTNSNTNKAGSLVNGGEINFTDGSFGAGLIEDSADLTVRAKGGSRTSCFLIKVYDSTVQGKHPVTGSIPGEEDQLAHAVVIKVAVDNTDTAAPAVSVDPFYWNSDADNSLYKNSRANGHIELEGDLPVYFKALSGGINDRDPKVSGSVSFRGRAEDGHTIGAIYFRINNHSNDSVNHTNGTITYNAAINEGGQTYYRAASYLDGVWNEVDRFASRGWKFTVEPGSNPNADGHIVRWRMDFDSSFITGKANADNVFSIIAVDTSGNISGPGACRFDVVPYISELKTKLSDAYSSVPSAFNRSALGGYPVRENEIIEIRGFNLDGKNTGVSVNGTALSGIGPFRADAANDKTHIVACIGTSANSGELEVAVNGISSLNNKNSNNAVYNREPNGLNNNILNDNRRLYVWNTGCLLNNRTALNPFMRMDKNANWYLSYGYFRDTGPTGGEFWVVKNNDATKVENYYNRFINTTIAFDESGDWYSAATNLAGTGNPSFTFYARGGNTGAAHGNAGNNRRVIMRIENRNVYDGDRAKIPRIFAQNTGGRPFPAGIAADTVMDNNATRIFFSYYDNNSSDNPVLFHYGTVGRNLTTGSYAGGDLAASNTPTGASIGSRHPAAQEVANNSQVHKGSMYTAVGALSNGLPVIAWYDRTKQRLIFSYGSDVPRSNYYSSADAYVKTSTHQWQDNARIVHEGVGTHVDMAIDESDNIHLAYYDVINGGLYYARIPVTGSGAAARPSPGGADNLSIGSNIRKARVDTFLSAGTKLMINIRREGGKDVPYISYWHASFAETRNPIRVAWLLPDENGDMAVRDGTYGRSGTHISSADYPNDSFTGAWEVMTVPAGEDSAGIDSIPESDEFICNGVPSANTWTLPGGASALHHNSNMDKTILLGYLTNHWYEGAVLKDDITKR